MLHITEDLVALGVVVFEVVPLEWSISHWIYWHSQLVIRCCLCQIHFLWVTYLVLFSDEWWLQVDEDLLLILRKIVLAISPDQVAGAWVQMSLWLVKGMRCGYLLVVLPVVFASSDQLFNDSGLLEFIIYWFSSVAVYSKLKSSPPDRVCFGNCFKEMFSLCIADDCIDFVLAESRRHGFLRRTHSTIGIRSFHFDCHARS